MCAMRHLLAAVFSYAALPLFALAALAIIWARFLPVPSTPYMIGEALREGTIKQEWVGTNELPRHIAATIIASEDSGFCRHTGVEWEILNEVMRTGAERGGSTISQQMVKNLLLWQGDSRASKYLRKAIEIPLTQFVEMIYPKGRIMEVYLNIIEYDTGVFGIEMAAQHHFRVSAAELSPHQMALLAAVLPSPKRYSAVPPTPYIAKRARLIERWARDAQALNLDSCVL